MLRISMRDAGKVRILDLKGQVNHGEGVVTLNDAVNRLMREGQGRIVLNLKAVEWIDSSGLGQLVACHLRARRIEGGIKLVLPSKQVLNTLTIVGLNKVFEIYDDEVNAVGSF